MLDDEIAGVRARIEAAEHRLRALREAVHRDRQQGRPTDSGLFLIGQAELTLLMFRTRLAALMAERET